VRGVLALLATAVLARGAAAADLRPSWLADLSADALAKVRAEAPAADAASVLSAVLGAEKGYRFAAGPFVVTTDRRWFSTLPGGGPGAPSLEVRRWPGDTVLALYALSGEALSDSTKLLLPGAALEPRAGGEGERRFEGTIPTTAGARRALWIERTVARPGVRVGALLVPGDAGLGDGAVASLEDEMLFVLSRMEVDPARWIPGMEQDQVALPDLSGPPGARDERSDPWQVAEAAGFTLGLPPGLRARRLDLGVAAAREVPGASLWLRGRFIDRDGNAVAVGDGSRAGYVAEIASPREGFASGALPPAGAPSAQRVDGDVLDDAIHEWTGARVARVDHFREPGFAGDWLVFRLAFPGRGVEIGLPVVQGWRSLALFWIPFTWRPAGKAPAPPPVDPAERFGIRFQQLSRVEQKQSPMVQCYLTAPGLRAELPSGWWPIASLKTADGFPILIVDREGLEVARIQRIASPEDPPGPQWTALPRPGSQNARAIYAGASGARLFVAREGHAFLLEPNGERKVEADLWARVAGNVVLTRPRP